MKYHFVVGDHAAGPLRETLAQDPEQELIVLRDILNVGPLKKEAEEQRFSDLRSNFWQEVAPDPKSPAQVDDMERLLEVSKQMYENSDAVAWFWMAPLPADVCAYHWLLPYLGKHAGRFFVVNIAGLPFLNESGKVFFPQSIAQLSVKEIGKAMKLARPVNNSELEVDTYEWKKLQQENAGIRVHGGGKKLSSQPEDHYDGKLLDHCSTQFQKAAKVLNQAMSKQLIPTGDLYLAWRLRQMAAAGRLELQGDPTKTAKDFEVRLPNTDTASATL